MFIFHHLVTVAQYALNDTIPYTKIVIELVRIYSVSSKDLTAFHQYQ